MGKCRFLPQVLDFDQNGSHFRDFHQILGNTVVFKAKTNKLGKLQKWEKNGKVPFSPQMLNFDQNESHFRGFHQIQVKIVVFEAKSNKLGKLQKWEKWKMSISSSNIGFWSKWITSS